MSKVLTLRGRKEGVMLCVTKGYNFEDFFRSFKSLVNSENSFFKGVKIVGIEGIELTEKDKTEFKKFVDNIDGIELLEFKYHDSSKEKKRIIGDVKDSNINLAYNKMDILEKIFLEEEDFMSDSLFFRGTVRSGVRLESEKNIVVVGDVNPGAELIAKSNIVVLGRLKGFAHAGSDGSKDKIIAAWKLEPTQIRIADYITIPPEGELEDINYPEMALIENGRVIIKSYQ